MSPQASPGSSPSPLVFDAVRERTALVVSWRRWVDATLQAQVTTGPEKGAFNEHGNGWFDGRFAAFTLARLGAAWLWREELALDRRAVREAMHLALEFIGRRQAPDGRLDLAGMYSPNEVGFTLPGLCETYRRLKEDRGGEWGPFLDRLEQFLRKGADAVVAGEAYTANHRWTAAAGPLAAVHRLWPEDRYLAKIERYLDDGIDCDADGCWYEERSPNYNAVAATGIMVLADQLERPELLDVLKRHGRFLLRMLQPNGEIDSTFSHRQDRHKPGCAPTTYAIARRLAQVTQDGRFTALALSLLDSPAAEPTADLLPLPFQLDRYRETVPAPQRIEDHYEVELAHVQVARIRRGHSALTVAADRGGHFYDTVRDRWAGAHRSDDWFHLHHGNVVIETLHLGCAGMQNMQPALLHREAPARYVLRGEGKGWVHTQQFRPRSPQIFMPWDWTYGADVEWRDDDVRVAMESRSPHSLAATLKLWVRAGTQVREGAGAAFALATGQSHALRGGAEVTITGSDGRRVTIQGLPEGRHEADFSHAPSIPAALSEGCASLRLGLVFPVSLQIAFHLNG